MQGKWLLWIAFADLWSVLAHTVCTVQVDLLKRYSIMIPHSCPLHMYISAHPYSAEDDSFLSNCVTFDGYSSYINVKDTSVFTGLMMWVITLASTTALCKPAWPAVKVHIYTVYYNLYTCKHHSQTTPCVDTFRVTVSACMYVLIEPFYQWVLLVVGFTICSFVSPFNYGACVVDTGLPLSLTLV